MKMLEKIWQDSKGKKWLVRPMTAIGTENKYLPKDYLDSKLGFLE